MSERIKEIEILEFYLQMGIKEAFADDPINYLQKKELKPENKVSIMPKKVKINSPSEIEIVTRQIADDCKNIDDLKSAVNNFKDLSITKTATNVVFADGDFNSDIMLIGEAPGADEDLQGIPFCGASGKMLESALKYINLERSKNFYITNTLFWRPPGNRKPTNEELMICKPFLEKHIALFKPKLIILIGATSVSGVLGIKEGISKIRGKQFNYKNQYIENDIVTIPIFHPSYLLRSPGQKKHFWQDLLRIKSYIHNKII